MEQLGSLVRQQKRLGLLVRSSCHHRSLELRQKMLGNWVHRQRAHLE
jgi:hypothetical protein